LSVINRNKSDLTFNSQLHSSKQSQAQQESFFKNINYFILKNYKPKLQLNATEVSVNNVTNRTLFFDPKGIAYSNRQNKIHYEGMKGTYIQRRGILHISKKVKMKMEENSSSLVAKEVIYNLNMGRIDARGDVKSKSISKMNGDKILVNSDRAISWTRRNETKYFGNVNGKVVRKRVYESPILYRSNKLHLKMNQHLINLEGDVVIKKQTFTARSRRGKLYLENYNKRLKYFALYDDVKVVEKVKLGRSVFLRKAFAEQLDGIVSEGKMVLTGYPKVYQQGDEIKGNKIILRENNDVVEVEDANSTFKSN
jgi:lipopolysaccharide export system protein LptA